jgi:hypothetical protein
LQSEGVNCPKTEDSYPQRHQHVCLEAIPESKCDGIFDRNAELSLRWLFSSVNTSNVEQNSTISPRNASTLSTGVKTFQDLPSAIDCFRSMDHCRVLFVGSLRLLENGDPKLLEQLQFVR